jgi:Fe-S cluster assembly iron-binding protein IscA
MLVLTPAAVKVVIAITSAEDVPDGSGLRIAPSDESSAFVLEVEIVSGPAEHDHIVNEHGALVFLDPTAASYLDDKVLNAEVNETGEAQLTLFTQNNNRTVPHA